MNNVLEVQKLAKKYRIYQNKQEYVALRDIITEIPKKLFNFKRRLTQDFWALKDINFKIKKGEVIGVIGPNGAGKSTLLKLLSRITPPTRGEIKIRGQVASLLEVGTGFHPELTGKENIYLNGSILGMSRKEINKKFNDIVEFSGVKQFINTPVKRYSSGMQVRLAFSVAAYLEPDILLIDEVLAVGDAEFQKKCLGKMESVSKQGRTVIFVSHNMNAVTRLCKRGILLKKGRLVLDSNINSVVREYLKLDRDTPAEKVWKKNMPGDDVAQLKSVRVLTKSGKVNHSFDITSDIVIEMKYLSFETKHLFTAFSFFDNQGNLLFVSPNWSNKQIQKGLNQARCIIPGNLFTEGLFRVVAEVSTQKPFYIKHILEYDAVSFQIVDKGLPGSVRSGWGNNLPGMMRPKLNWENKFISGI